MNVDRSWMYQRVKDNFLNPEFVNGVEEFIAFACGQQDWMDGSRIKCPCNLRKCQNKAYRDVETVKIHLCKKGFLPGYYIWYCHGETESRGESSNQRADTVYETTENYNVASENYYMASENYNQYDNFNQYEEMEMDVGVSGINQGTFIEEPNSESQNFYDMLGAANEQLWPGCENHSQLSVAARLLNIKAEYHLSEAAFDSVAGLMKEVLPSENIVSDTFYKTKKLLHGLGLPVQKIDCCKNNCMLFWGVDVDLQFCKICDEPRFMATRRSSNTRRPVAFKKMHYFPLVPRLQRMYQSEVTASDMRWHAEHEEEEGVMSHPSDSIAWKHFNDMHPDFSYEKRNVRLALSTDGFQPFGQSGQQYSCWPVIVTVLNLPPWLCMKDSSMFLTVLVPGPSNPKEKIDVFLQPLISELKLLWSEGFMTYDISLKQNFIMKAALMWTISDFPAYAMLSGWSTAGRLACPYCMKNSDAFTLCKSGKQSWFDNHRKFLPSRHPFRRNKISFLKNTVINKNAPPILSGQEILDFIEQLGLMNVFEDGADVVNGRICREHGWRKKSIFWELPYWSTNLIRHNLDVMHIEKNFFDNIFHTVMNIPGKTKDTLKSREELNQYCRRPELARSSVDGKYPKACYTLDRNSKAVLCDWLKGLKFPDGYASNMGRCVDMHKLRVFGMKSHDCHVFMQRLMPIAFRELLPANVWKPLTEISIFFKELTARVIRTNDMARLEEEIPIILCKLERIFPPSFFNCMEHLPIHLAYEARIAGPVQYRWMYPFERYMKKLKKNVRNKAKVEGSICNAYLVEEASNFASHYFDEHVQTKNRKVPRNLDGCRQPFGADDGTISIFRTIGRPFGTETKRYMLNEEFKAAHNYILMNCSEVEPFIEMFCDMWRQQDPHISDDEIGLKLYTEFAYWFNEHTNNRSSNVDDLFIKSLAQWPLSRVNTYTGYFVNGYKFQVESLGSSRTTQNWGVCVQGQSVGADQQDYYGKLQEVVEVEYPGWPIKRTILFKCEWFDPTPNVGTKVHKDYNLVEICHRRRLNKYEPFILASQAEQVYYSTYPSLRKDKRDWWVVSKIKPRAIISMPVSSSTQTLESPAFQEDVMEAHAIQDDSLDPDPIRNDPTGASLEIEDVDDASNDEENEYESQSETESDEEPELENINDSD